MYNYADNSVILKLMSNINIILIIIILIVKKYYSLIFALYSKIYNYNYTHRYFGISAASVVENN